MQKISVEELFYFTTSKEWKQWWFRRGGDSTFHGEHYRATIQSSLKRSQCKLYRKLQHHRWKFFSISLSVSLFFLFSFLGWIGQKGIYSHHWSFVLLFSSSLIILLLERCYVAFAVIHNSISPMYFGINNNLPISRDNMTW